MHIIFLILLHLVGPHEHRTPTAPSLPPSVHHNLRTTKRFCHPIAYAVIMSNI